MVPIMLPHQTDWNHPCSLFLRGFHMASTMSSVQTKRRTTFGSSFKSCSASPIFQNMSPASFLSGLRATGASMVSKFFQLRRHLSSCDVYFADHVYNTTGPKFTEVSHLLFGSFRLYFVSFVNWFSCLTDCQMFQLQILPPCSTLKLRINRSERKK